MKFNDWVMKYPASAQETVYRNGLSRQNNAFANHIEQLEFMEACWWMQRRPYYKVWPSVVPSLLRTKLDTPGEAVSFPLPIMAIRFSCETLIEGLPVRAMLLGVVSCGDAASLSAGCGRIIVLVHGIPKHLFAFLDLETGNTVEESLRKALSDSRFDYDDISDEDILLLTNCLRFVVSVGLLANDPSIIAPDVLSKDRQRFDATTDESLKQRLVSKAKKRNIVGWRIGESYETIPHYRRPHFGLRHTGKGGKYPKIVPIKGAVVHRSKMAKVPTGYQEEDGTEIES